MTTANRRGRGKPKGLAKSGGRQKGTPNKVTHDFRVSVADLLEANAKEMAGWLKSVAEGAPEFGREPDPARALDLLAKLAEYAAPKLGRVEHTGEGGGPVHVTSIELEFLDAHAPAYLNGHDGSSPRLPAPDIIETSP